MRRTTLGHVEIAAVIIACGLAVGPAGADMVFHDVKASTTSTSLHGGNRELLTLGFKNGASSMSGSNFGNFTAGGMTTHVDGSPVSFGWNHPILRDMTTSGNRVSGNPDRSDSASLFANELTSAGTLGEVFGTSALGYKNLSWIIDGEDSSAGKGYALDLIFGGGRTISADSDDKTVEFALLERGMNSDINVYGIRADNTLTEALFIGRNKLANAGWTLNTLEIGGNQKVGGVGVSLSSSWTSLIGFRLEQKGGFNGPDIVGVGTAMPVPSPGALAALGVASLALTRRRRG